MKTILIKNGKGGDGKTTAAINIAAALGEILNKKVLIVDLDAQHNTSSFFLKDVPVTGTVGDCLLHNAEAKHSILKTIYQNVDILPSCERLYEQVKDIEGTIMVPAHTRLQKALESIQCDYDFVIIDSNPNFDILAVNAFVAADICLIPTSADKDSRDAVTRTLTAVEQIQSGFNEKLKYLIFVSRRGRTNETIQAIAEMKELYKGHFLKTSIRYQEKPFKKLYKKLDSRMPVVIQRDLSEAGREYIELSKELLQHV